MKAVFEVVKENIDNMGFEYREHVKIGRWEADLVVDTPERNRVIMEIREKGSIPAVLIIASMTHQIRERSKENNAIGTLSLFTEPIESVKTAARNNDVHVLIWNNEFNARKTLLDIVNGKSKDMLDIV